MVAEVIWEKKQQAQEKHRRSAVWLRIQVAFVHLCALLNFFPLGALVLKKKKKRLCRLRAPPLTGSSHNPEVMNWHWRPPSLRYVIKSSHQLILWRNMPSDDTQSSLSVSLPVCIHCDKSQSVAKSWYCLAEGQAKQKGLIQVLMLFHVLELNALPNTAALHRYRKGASLRETETITCSRMPWL